MALDVYRALVALHAAVTFHLYETARPLPQMLDYPVRRCRVRRWCCRIGSTIRRRGPTSCAKKTKSSIQPSLRARGGRWRSEMPNPHEVAQLIVGGMVFEDWESVYVQHRWQEGWPTFRFTAAEGAKLPFDWAKLQFKPGDPCPIILGGELAVTGIITQRQVAYAGDRARRAIVWRRQAMGRRPRRACQARTTRTISTT